MRYPFQNPVPHHHLLLLTTTTLLPFIIPPTLALPPSAGTDPRLDDNHPTSSNTDDTNTPQVQGTPNPLLPDPCGPPEHQDLHAKPASQSTCNRRIGRGWEEGDPFRLSCTQDATGYTIDWGSCTASVGAACVVLEYLGKQGPVGAGRERWVWPVAPIGAFNCSLGFWVPKNSSLLPTYDRCKADIFGQMIEGCQGDATANVASANLKRLPRRTETERDTGEAFDPLYPSYIIVAQNSVANAVTR